MRRAVAVIIALTLPAPAFAGACGERPPMPAVISSAVSAEAWLTWAGDMVDDYEQRSATYLACLRRELGEAEADRLHVAASADLVNARLMHAPPGGGPFHRKPPG